MENTPHQPGDKTGPGKKSQQTNQAITDTKQPPSTNQRNRDEELTEDSFTYDEEE